MGFWSRLFGKRDQPSAPAPSEIPADKAWIMGTSAWGGVLLECGSMEMALVLLPITDPAAYRELPTFPPGMIKVVIACNDHDHGVLAASKVARAVGHVDVLATDADRPIDRGGEAGEPVVVAQLRKVEVGALTLLVHTGAVWATWVNGTTALVGDAISVHAIADEPPMNVLGRLVVSAEPGDERTLADATIDAAVGVKRYVAMANVPGKPDDDEFIAHTFGHITEIAHPAAAAPRNAPRVPVKDHVIACIIGGRLDEADRLAAAALDRGDDVGEMRFQRALIAMMRDDDAAAIALLEQATDDPRAASSLCQLYARKHDPRARELAARALAGLPGDPIAIRAAIIAHALTGDPAGARALLAEHGTHLDPGERVAFDRTIDAPPAPRRHRFPEHAQFAANAAKPLTDAQRFVEAEVLLRRAVALDDTADEHVAELGYVLAQLGRNEDAVAVYDAAVDAGGSPLLRFNRGNCLLRLQRYDAAVDDFRACVDALPERHDMRINLVSALFASGRTGAARAELAELQRQGASPSVIGSLESMLAGSA